MVEGITEGIEKVGIGGSGIIEKIKEGVMEGGRRALGAPFMDESIWIEKLKDYIRKKRGGGEEADAYSSMGEDDESAIENAVEREMKRAQKMDFEFITHQEALERVLPKFRKPRDPRDPRGPGLMRPRRPQEEIEEVGIESLRGGI